MIKVIENKETGKIIIGEYEIEGFIDDETCLKCSQNKVYYDDYDAFICPQCNVWLESACADSSCEYCSKRPDKPLLRSEEF